MTARDSDRAMIETFLSSLAGRHIRLLPDGDDLVVEPASRLTDDDRQTIRQHKTELLAYLHATEASHQPARSIRPDSRYPLVAPEIRTKIEAIEAEARAKGWPAELLWNAGYWDSPRGLAALLDAGDEIAEVTPDYVAILKTRRDLLRFQRHAA